MESFKHRENLSRFSDLLLQVTDKASTSKFTSCLRRREPKRHSKTRAAARMIKLVVPVAQSAQDQDNERKLREELVVSSRQYPVLAIALLASSSLSPSIAQGPVNLRLQCRKPLPYSLTRTPSDSRANAPSVIDLETTTVSWIAIEDAMRDSDCMGREVSPDRRMRRDRDQYFDSDKDRGRYGDRAEEDKQRIGPRRPKSGLRGCL